MTTVPRSDVDLRQAVASAALLLTLSTLVNSQASAELFPAPQLVAHWGHQGTEPGSFFAVMAIAVAPDGSVYAVDSQGRIEKFSADGEFWLQWGARGSGDGQFLSPTGIAVGPSGEIYVSEYRGNRIQVFDRNGRFLRKWGTPGSGPGQFNGPERIAVDSRGDVYVTDTGNVRVQKFSSTGRFKTAWGRRGTANGEFVLPVGIAVSADGRVFVADLTAGGVQIFSSEGRFLARWGPGTVEVPRPKEIPSLKHARKGQPIERAMLVPVLTADLHKALCDSSLQKPSGIAVDSVGTVYVLNSLCDRVQRYAPSGRFLGGWWIAERPTHIMERMTDIAVGRQGDVYVAEMNGPRIRKFGHGPIRSERIVAESLGPGSLRMLDSLVSIPFGERPPARSAAGAGAIRLEWRYMGFNQAPTVESARWEVELPQSPGAKLVGAALVDALRRRMGAPPAPADAVPATVGSASIERAGVVIRSRLIRQAGGGVRIKIESESPNARMASLSPDTCDLRLLEGGLTEPTGSREALLRGLRSRWPDLAEALGEDRVTEASLLTAVQRAAKPGVSEADRDLVLLAADQWLRSPGASQQVASLRHGLGGAWARLGFLTFPAGGSDQEYCGSILDSLAARAGQNEWADRALLLLLDKGWVTDCGGDYEGAEFGNDLFAPVLKRGEVFLASHRRAGLWPSVALRVALAHETVWSLSERRGLDDSHPELRAEAPGHRRRALELYRDLAGRTRDATLQRALSRRIRSLERGVDTKCTVYYLEGEC